MGPAEARYLRVMRELLGGLTSLARAAHQRGDHAKAHELEAAWHVAASEMLRHFAP